METLPDASEREALSAPCPTPVLKPITVHAFGLGALALVAFAPCGASQGFTSTPSAAFQRTLVVKSPLGPLLELQQTYGPLMPGGGQQALGATTNSNLVWSRASDGSWIAESISLGNDGTEVFAEFGDFTNWVELHSAHSQDAQTPFWAVSRPGLNARRRVDSAERSQVHVSGNLVYQASNGLWFAELRKFSLDSSQADWTFSSALAGVSDDFLEVAVSEDGQRIVLVEWEGPAGASRVSVFGPDSATPLQVYSVPTFGGVQRQQLSEDGSTLMLVSNQKVTIVDLASGALTFEDYFFGTPEYFAFTISGEGTHFAMGRQGQLRLYSQDESGVYVQQQMVPLQGPYFPRSMDFSYDGSVLVAGVQKLNDVNAVRFLAVDSVSGEVVFDVELSGSGSFSNRIEEVECDYAGTCFAAGLWGDEDGALPEVLGFRLTSTEPILAADLPGSVYGISLSPDGRHVAVASKGVHRSVWGGGGAYDLYRLGGRELEVEGLPLANDTVQLRHFLREGISGRVLVATALADAPAEAPQYGAGLLYLDPTSLLELPAQVGSADNAALSNFLLGAAGSEYFFQPVNLDNGELGRTWVKVTVAP